MRKAALFIFVSLLSIRAEACLETVEPQLISIPAPIWIGSEPGVSEATVRARVLVSDKGGVDHVEIISVNPVDLPVGPLKAAIRLARYVPGRHKTSSESEWSLGAQAVEQEFAISW